MNNEIELVVTVAQVSLISEIIKGHYGQLHMNDNTRIELELLNVYLTDVLAMLQDLDKERKSNYTPPFYVHPDSNAFISWD